MQPGFVERYRADLRLIPVVRPTRGNVSQKPFRAVLTVLSLRGASRMLLRGISRPVNQWGGRQRASENDGCPEPKQATGRGPTGSSSRTGESANSPYRADLRNFGRRMGIKQLTNGERHFAGSFWLLR